MPNTKSGDDTFIDYDAANRAMKITVGSSSTTSSPTARDEFWYGPDGQRFLRKETFQDGSLKTQWRLYLWGGVFEEVHPDSSEAVDHRQRIQVTESVLHRTITYPSSNSTSIEYLHRDHLGSVSTISSSSGGVIRDMSFDVFGGRRESDWSEDVTVSSMNSLLNDDLYYSGRGYTDHEHLNRTNVVHMNGRIYDARIGRFLQPDPLVEEFAFSQDHNRYAYGRNSPLSFVDPTGYYDEGPGGGFQIGVSIGHRGPVTFNIYAADPNTWEDPTREDSYTGIRNTNEQNSSSYTSTPMMLELHQFKHPGFTQRNLNRRSPSESSVNYENALKLGQTAGVLSVTLVADALLELKFGVSVGPYVSAGVVIVKQMASGQYEAAEVFGVLTGSAAGVAVVAPLIVMQAPLPIVIVVGSVAALGASEVFEQSYQYLVPPRRLEATEDGQQ